MPTTNLVPADRDATAASADFAARLFRELNPTTSLEALYTEDIARHRELLREVDAALLALRSSGEAAVATVLTDCTGVAVADFATASVVASDHYSRLMRQRHALSRDLSRGIRELIQLRNESTRSLAGGLQLDPRFATELACITHLTRRYVQALCPCQHCGERGTGSLVAARFCWQCGRCHAQTGLRRGTCMERSSLALVKWFAAIRVVLLLPSVPVAELAAFLGIARIQTVTQMGRTIRRAIASAEPSQRLAGLDEIYLGSC